MSTMQRPVEQFIDTEAAIPKGKRAYLAAQIALIDMRAAMNCELGREWISATKQSIGFIANADREGLLEPPLTPELSAAIQGADAYGALLGAYQHDISLSYKVQSEANPDVLHEAAMLVAAVVNYGLGAVTIEQPQLNVPSPKTHWRDL